MELDVEMLSRIQFAFTVFFHFIFVPLTIGLGIIMAVVETQYARTLNPVYRQMSDFWGKLFAINMLLGIVTGITMEFQFGTNWSEYAKFMGDVFGSPLALEALLAFFLESTFIGIWYFGRDRFSPKLRAFSMWMVSIGTFISALWIITVNGFMQNPVGYEIVNVNGSEQVVLTSFIELVTNPYAWFMFIHTILACFIVGSFFVLGVSAWHLVRKNHVTMFKKSFKYAIILATIATTLIPIVGHKYGVYVAEVQPAKAAAFEATWETGVQDFAIIKFVNSEGEVILEGPGIPKLGSWIYTEDVNGEVTGLNDIPEDERPPVALVFYPFRAMITISFILLALAWIGVFKYKRGSLVDSTRYLKILPWAIVLPYLATNLGWMVAEVGRQPWVVNGLMKTEEAVSPIPEAQVWFSLICLILFYGILLAVNLYLQFKYARKGPETIDLDGPDDTDDDAELDRDPYMIEEEQKEAEHVVVGGGVEIVT